MRQPTVYIMASRRHGTLYTGVTSDLVKRVWQHRTGATDGFTKRYDCKLLVWYEAGGDMEPAILREKQIKGGSRARKIALIEERIPTGVTYGPTSPTPKPVIASEARQSI